MPVARQRDLGNQIYAHHWIYNPVPLKVRECSLVDETWVVCSMILGLERLPLPSVQCLKVFDFSL